MNVYRRKRRRGGRVVLDKHYTGTHRFPGDVKAKFWALRTTDKQVALLKLREAVSQEERERAGLVLPLRQVQAANRPLADHLREFISDHSTKEHNRDYVQHLRKRIQRLMKECDWNRVRDITPESFTTWRDLHKNTLSPKTLNEYLAAAAGFMKWLQGRRQIESNPLSCVGRVESRGRETFKRRVLSPVELQRLIEVSGERGAMYLAAVYTCFRKNELRGLRWSDVHLDDTPPRIVLTPRLSKNRQQRVMPIRVELLAVLSAMKSKGSKPTDLVFAHLLPRKKLDLLKADLASAGIAYVDDQGHKMDFHAFRHTGATWGGATGVAGPTLQAFTGHKTASQVARYVHTEYLPSMAVVERMPGLEVGTVIGTISVGRNGPGASQTGISGQGAVQQKTREKQAISSVKQGEIACDKKVERSSKPPNPTQKCPRLHFSRI